MGDNTSRQAAFRQRMKERGIAQVTVWLPVRDRERLKKYAAKLLRIFEKEKASADDGGSNGS